MSNKNRRTLWSLVVATALGTTLLQPASAAGDDAGQILKAMSDYLTSQKTISATYNSDIEVITPDLQKIQFNSSGTILMNRPDRIRATRIGGYSSVELVFDGKIFTLYGGNINRYLQLEAPGPLEKLIETLREQSIYMPGADLLVPEAYEKLMARVIDAKHIGRGVIGSFECDHLAFRTQDTDWQLWVQIGANPIPRKFVITSKAMGAAPQYTLLIEDWKTDLPTDATAFVFDKPVGASKLWPDEVKNLDEFPPGVLAKGP